MPNRQKIAMIKQEIATTCYHTGNKNENILLF